MAPKTKPTRTVPAAERKAYAGENESQDSQALLEEYLLKHGVGVFSSSPPIDELGQLGKDNHDISCLELKTPSNLIQPKNASNAVRESDEPDESDIANDFSKQPSHQQYPAHSTAPQSSRTSLLWEARGVVPDPIPTNPDDATSVLELPSSLIRNDALSQVPPSSVPLKKNKKKRTTDMSSQSPTQSNEGRSYDQYVDSDSQRHSCQGSSAHEHRTLYENDTGFVNFKGSQDDLPETAPAEADVNFDGDVHIRSQQHALEAPSTNGHLAAAPETPAIPQRTFSLGGISGQLLPPSQLFGQTQYTSAVKKASPTSSRPSPHLFNQNTISPNLVVSSPLKDRGLRTSPTHQFISSPAFPEISSRPSGDKTSSAPKNGRNEGLEQANAAEAPHSDFDISKRRSGREPIDKYRPIRLQSPEIGATRPLSQSSKDSDFEADDDALYRRQRAKLRQERASKSLASLSYNRSSSNKGDNVEVPSTNRTRSGRGRKQPDSERYLIQSHGRRATNKDGSQDTVADSQDIPAPPIPDEATKTDPKSSDEAKEDNIDNTEDGSAVDFPTSRAANRLNAAYRETIPETSPLGASTEPPRLLADVMRQSSSAQSGMETVSLPTLSGGTDVEQQENHFNIHPHSSLTEPSSAAQLPPNYYQLSSRNQVAVDASPSIVLASSQQSATRLEPLKTASTPSSVPMLPPPSDPGTLTSTLTTLSATPNMSSSTTPNTETDELNDNNGQVSSPAAARVKRRGRLPSALLGPSSSLSQFRTYSRSRESTRRKTRHSSMSTDELANSSPPVLNKDGQKPTIRKLARQSIASQHPLRGSTITGGVFQGMVFALSFQGGQSRKSKEKHTDRAAIERMIRLEGGRILSDGFDELFQFDSLQTVANSPSTPVLSSSLKLRDEDNGFTALIADGHSRKVKYMQALALGIPCLAPKWITTCISKKQVVDWFSYLLCAGPSALLGEAIRSRSLQPYDASTAKLADVISHRPKLLNASQILLVMKKTKNEEKRLPYVFLAQVLGGSLVRVHSLEEAKAKLREKEAQGRPFDWVYVDDHHLHDVQTALLGPGATAGETTGPRKRKRQSAAAEAGESDRPPKRIRTLNDELVIQSLILGRLIEDGEMEE
ncbi:hypothetical protein F4779DRAFT_231797 [Xylariaceae sp. FL0662B]|nr:hypothetical protein F4779DRAFT_231797 [Xylariaceae sp. FL0662B]